MNDQDRLEQQEALSALADRYFIEAIEKGDAFTEGLCNWAMNKAERELGSI